MFSIDLFIDFQGLIGLILGGQERQGKALKARQKRRGKGKAHRPFGSISTCPVGLPGNDTNGQAPHAGVDLLSLENRCLNFSVFFADE